MTELEFPLFTKLPQAARKNVLRTMNYGELISYSLCSKSTKRLAVSLKYTAQSIDFSKERLEIQFQNTDSVKSLNAVFESPSTINLQSLSDYLSAVSVGKYQIAGFECNHWVEHFGSVFNTKHIKNLRVFNDRVPIEDIQNAIGSMQFDSLRMLRLGPRYAEQLVNKLVPRTKIYDLEGLFQSGSTVLQQNLESLTVLQCQTWKLNDLLLLNAKCACLRSITLTTRDLNRFFKLWAKGSNPNLIHFECGAEQGGFDKDEIKKGIDGVEVPVDTARFFRIVASGLIKVNGGFDIRRCDGRIGTLHFQDNTCLHFFVHQ